MERRKGGSNPAEVILARSSPLPVDYFKMITEVFASNFDAGLQALAKLSEGSLSFVPSGAIFADEIVLCVSIVEKDQLAATSVYASADFDPKASSPTVQDLLASCVDAIGAIYAQLLSADTPEVLEQVASHTLAALEGIPYYWTEVKIENRRIHMKVDKSNPTLDSAADEWLRKNDPSLKEHIDEEEQETKKLFVTGPQSRKPGGTVH